MRRKLLLLNLVMLALLAALGWRLRTEWLEARQRERAVLAATPKPVPAATAPVSAAPPPLTAAQYAEVAQHTLFHKDRNPDVQIEVAPPKPMPPLPVARGFMDFGNGPTVILGEKPGGPHKAFRVGEAIGEFKLLAASRDELVFEWDGRQIRKRMEELIDRSEKTEGAPVAPAARAAAPAAAPASASLSAATNAAPKGPGADMGAGNRACAPGDQSPAGTVLDGMKKVTMNSPFGAKCWWEPAK